MANKGWENWKQEQVDAAPRRARKRVRELLDSVPGSSTSAERRFKKLREVVEEIQRLLGGKDWRKRRGKE